MDQIQLGYSLLKETVTAIMIQEDGHTKFFHIVSEVFLGDTFTPYIYIYTLLGLRI